jgi:hypothetical protein
MGVGARAPEDAVLEGDTLVARVFKHEGQHARQDPDARQKLEPLSVRRAAPSLRIPAERIHNLHPDTDT